VDFRDLGFDARAVLLTGIVLLVIVFLRRPPMRRAIALAAVAGLSCWTIATAAAGMDSGHETLPAVALVNQGETPQTVRAFLDTQQLSANSVLLDPSLRWAKASHTQGFPTTLFYAADGTLLAAHLGPFSRATFERAIQTVYPAALTASAQ